MGPASGGIISISNIRAARATVKALVIAVVVSTASAVPAAAQGSTPCSSVSQPRANIYVSTHTSNAVYRNQSVTFTGGGTPTTTSPSSCATPHGTKIVKWEWDWDGNGSADRTTSHERHLDDRDLHLHVAQVGQLREAARDRRHRQQLGLELHPLQHHQQAADRVRQRRNRLPRRVDHARRLRLLGHRRADQELPLGPRQQRHAGPLDHRLLDDPLVVDPRHQDDRPARRGQRRRALAHGTPPPFRSSTGTRSRRSAARPRLPKINETITCSSSSDDPDSSLSLSHQWNTGSGYSSGSSTKTVSYDDPGSHTIRLKVTDNDGGTDETAEDR